MRRNKKNRIFDLFKSNFKISFFYKPSMEFGDDVYYILLDDVIKLGMKIINNVLVIESVSSISQSYVKPLYDKIVTTIMGQDEITVIVSTLGNTEEIRQSCISHGAPIIDEEQYITGSKNFYNKWKVYIDDINKYGFYVLSVSEETSSITEPQVKVVDTPSNVINEHKPVEERLLVTGNETLDKFKCILKKSFSNMTFNVISENNLQCNLSEEETFYLELVDNTLYIKDLMQNPSNNLNLVQSMNLLNSFEQFISITPNIFIISIMNKEIYRLCSAKGYELVEEAQKLPLNKLFKQAFHGFGTYKVVINN